MILADSSVWIDHWRRDRPAMSAALSHGLVAVHPFVIGELACGNMPKPSTTLGLLNRLPLIAAARHGEVMTLVTSHQLAGSGIGWVDAHLLAAARLASVPLWTLDLRLRRVAVRIGVYGEPEV